MTLPSVYVASKLHNAEKLIRFGERWSNTIRITSRWLNMAYLEKMKEQPTEIFTYGWCVDLNDVMTSQYLLVYGEPEDELRGALVEVGVALGRGTPVFCVGKCPSFGTWQYHPQVTRLETLDNAASIIFEWSQHSYGVQK